MSVQKLVAEADKLFDKGKIPEGIAKLKSAFSQEPLNQIVATKLANVYVQNQGPLEAAKVYGILAKNLSEAGKAQVAIAIFKQALELAPEDITLRVRFAQECEAAGKLGDAFLQGQIALNFYLRRKKFFDASNILPLLARAQPRDDKIKMAWVEILQLCQAEQKLVHLLVALCGPPGLVSQEFPVGGEPTSLTPALYEGLKKLVPYFPRDPKIAYTLAWCAYRRGQLKEFYLYLHECLRREPDFCLGILLFARALAEEKKLNEALFVYRYFKERMTADRNVDMLTLNRLMEAFLEKNGWIKFIEDSGDLLDTAGFVAAITGQSQETKEEERRKEATNTALKAPPRTAADLPPAEIELGGGDAATPEAMEILSATGQAIKDEEKNGKSPVPSGIPKAPPLPSAAPVASPPKPASAPPSLPTESTTTEDPSGFTGVTGKSVVFTSLIQTADPSLLAAELATDPSIKRPPPPIPGAAPKAPAVPERKAQETPAPVPERKLFNPLLDDTPTRAPDAEPAGERTQIFSPMEVLGAAKVMQNRDLEDVATKMIMGEALAAEMKSEDTPTDFPEGDRTRWRALSAAGEKTKEFSPVEAVQAGEKSRRPRESAIKPGEHAGPFAMPPAHPIPTFEPLPVPPPAPVVPPSVSAPAASPASLSAMPPVPEPAPPSNLQSNGPPAAVPAPASGAESEAVPLPENTSPGIPMPAAPTPYVPVLTPVPVVSPDVAALPPAIALALDEEPPTDTVGAQGATMVVRRSDIADEPAAVSGAMPLTSTVTQDPPGALEFTHTEPAESVTFDEASLALSNAEASIEPPAAHPADGPAFVPIPDLIPAAPAAPPGEKIDLGTDLLEGPTRIFTLPSIADKTEHLLQEIKQDLRQAPAARPPGVRLNVDLLMKKAERFTAKRNYYLARKALRHAQALGADESVVKARLREIRKLELPDGLYNSISSDATEAKVDTSEVLSRLEQEFELSEEIDDGSEEIGASLAQEIEVIFRESDPRTILDFGVGLHEMGLFRQAEALFIRLVTEYPVHAFDAYYLAAVAKLSRRDYAGAASILKRLSADSGKSDLEKIQIYYTLGETFEKMQQHDRSKKFFRKVAEIDANYRNIRYKLEE